MELQIHKVNAVQRSVNEPMIGAAEAAEMLSINVRTLKRMAERGQIPGMQIGNRWKFLASLLDEWRKSKLLSKCSDDSE